MVGWSRCSGSWRSNQFFGLGNGRGPDLAFGTGILIAVVLAVKAVPHFAAVFAGSLVVPAFFGGLGVARFNRIRIELATPA